MPVPNTFANATATIPLSQLDANFATAITLGNTAIQLGNTVTTLNNMTLANVTISSGNVTSINVTDVNVSNSAVISANTAGAALRITQTGTNANSIALLVEDSANPDSSPFVIDADGRIIDGFTAALNKYVDFNGSTVRTPQIQLQGASLSTAGLSATNWANANSPPAIYLAKSRSGTVGTQGSAGSTLNGDVLGVIQFNGDDGTNFVAGAAILGFADGSTGANDMPGRLVFSTTPDGSPTPTERMRIDSSGNINIATAGARITGDFSNATVANRVMFQTSTVNGNTNIHAITNGTGSVSSVQANNSSDPANGSQIYIAAGASVTQIAADKSGTGTFLPMTFYTGGSERMRLDTSGYVGIGTSSPGHPLQVNGNIVSSDGTTVNRMTRSGGVGLFGTTSNHPIAFQTNDTERARIDSSGNVLVGKTATGYGTAGVQLEATGSAGFTRSSEVPLVVNRLTNDGVLVSLRQATTEEGSISVSGTTVSYNAFAGSHWSQLQDGSKPEILRGTVMESIDELVQWPDEPTSERLCRSKISNTAGSKRVYGVFMCWDEDWTSTNDMLVTSLGAFVCRVNAGVTVQMGDLLESNGDGTARVQADDIIRSSTIGKVTSTVKTHEYDDGSYCVPTVLYCG